MSSEKKVRVTVEACGEVRSFECRCATVTAINGNGSGDACFVGAASPVDIATLAGAGVDTIAEALRQVGIPDGIARKLMLAAVLIADPRRHADSLQTIDLSARREIRDMAAELGGDVDF